MAAELAEERLQRPLLPLENALLEVVWSEHCSYRQSRERLRLFPSSGPRVRVGPGEGAGVVAWEGPLSVAFRIESHNHPSASDPREGAATGVGGILRDLVSTGAAPLFLGAALSLPPFPSSLEEGIREGLSHYAERVGLPVPLLAVQRSPAFAERPLVNVLAVGVRHEAWPLSSRGAYPGARLVVVGKPVDGMGLGAAAAASRAGEPFSSTVPPSDPDLGRKVLRLTLHLAKRRLILAVQDLGAGGLGGAAWEMAHKNGCGAFLDLEKVPSLPGVRDPFALLLAETQERMLLAVAPDRVDTVLDLARHGGIPAADIGAFTQDPHLVVCWGGQRWVSLSLALLGEGPAPRPWPSFPEKLALSRRERWFTHIPHVFSLGTHEGAVLLVQGGRALSRQPLGETFFLLVTAAFSLALGGFMPLAISNSLNLGEMEEETTARSFLAITEGIARGARELGLPVVSGNVSLQNKGQRSLPPVPVLALVGRRPLERETLLHGQYGEGILTWSPGKGPSLAAFLEEWVGLVQGGFFRFDPHRMEVHQVGEAFFIRFRGVRRPEAPEPPGMIWEPLGGGDRPWAS